MKLICENCGEDCCAYFDINTYNWYVGVVEGKNGNPELYTEPSDCEETRYHMNKIGPLGRIKEALEAGHALKTRKTFDCTYCGEEDCIRIEQEKD